MVKTLTIKENVYDELVKLKDRGESFSDLFERLAKKEKSGIMAFAGFLGEEDAAEMKKAISEHRKRTIKADRQREKRIEKAW